MYPGLKEYMEEKGYSQQRIASMLGVSVPYVNAILVGNKTLGKKGAKKWANLFGLSENFLLTGKGSPDPNKDETIQKEHYYSTIQKANRFVQVLNYLVDEGHISNHLAVAPVLNVTESVIEQVRKYDPDGKYDFVFVKLTQKYPFISLDWLLIGEGDMIINQDDEYNSYIEAKQMEKEEHISRLENELKLKESKIEGLQNELREARKRLDTQDDLINLQKDVIKKLESENSKLKSEEVLGKFPFNPGVADPKIQDTEVV